MPQHGGAQCQSSPPIPSATVVIILSIVILAVAVGLFVMLLKDERIVADRDAGPLYSERLRPVVDLDDTERSPSTVQTRPRTSMPL